MHIVQGDLIQLARSGEFEVIGHGCNCFSTMKRGIAPQMAQAFGCDTFPLEKKIIHPLDKLGRIDFTAIRRNDPGYPEFATNAIVAPQYEYSENILYVVNMYTQYHWAAPSVYNIPLDYDALRLCLRKVNVIFKGKHIGLPWVGCGLAGGNKEAVKDIMENELTDCELTIVEL